MESKKQIVITLDGDKIAEYTIKSLDEISKPEVTENYVRIPVNECQVTATIDIDKGNGIKALYCGNEKQIAIYLFPKDKYSMEEAQNWIKEHKDNKAEKSAKEYVIPIAKADNEKRLVYGIVMEPDTVDSQGDKTSAEEIEKAAHKFMLDSQAIFSEHENPEPDCNVVESYICPDNIKIGNCDVKKGSWIMVTHCAKDEIWDSVKKGELTGYSIRGIANRS